MEARHYTLTDGYVGSFGVVWHTPTDAELEGAIRGAMAMHNLTREQVIEKLDSGCKVPWCKSPNHYYDHSFGQLKRKDDAPWRPVALVHCDCGHDVPASERMNASLGTSCPDCYDRMSG